LVLQNIYANKEKYIKPFDILKIMELNDITEILRKNQGKPIKISSEDAINLLHYLMEEDTVKIDARYKLYPDLKYHVSGYHVPGCTEKNFEELTSVIKNHFYNKTGNAKCDGEKYIINLEGSQGKFFWIFPCREKMEITINY